MITKKLLFIVNPRAGINKSRAPLFDAVSIFSKAGYLVSVQETTAPGDATRLAREYGGDFDLVVCVGGDGTLNEMLSGLMALPQRPPVGYLPHGSTNDFATSLHLPSSPVKAALQIVGAVPQPLDLGTHNDRYFAYVASFGAFTRTSYSATRAAKNAFGHFAYILEGIGDLDSLRPYNCRVDTGDEVFEGGFIFGAVCNTTSLAGMVKLDPERVELSDGQFELLLLRPPKTALDLQNIIVAISQQQYDMPGVIFRHVSTVTVTTEDDIPWSLDGEYAASTPEVHIQVLKHCISMML
jgi:diacylglycerol kinase (ATP)